MGLFDRKKRELPPLISDEELGLNEPAVNFDSVLDYLVSLTEKDYGKLLKVAKIYRSANKAAEKVLPAEKQPPVIIDKESKPDDELDFIFDDEPKHKKPKSTKVTVKKG